MDDINLLAIRLAIVATCPRCQQPRAVVVSGLCSECGTDLPAEDVAAVRAAVRKRRQTFRKPLDRLVNRMHKELDRPFVFATRGTPLERLDYINQVVTPELGDVIVHHQEVVRLLAAGEWDSGTSESIQVFSDLVRSLGKGIDRVTRLLKIMPPLDLRGVHRDMVRAAAQFVRGQMHVAQMIIATDYDEVVRMRAASIAAIEQARKGSEQTTRMVKLADQKPANPFRTGGRLDIAALAWSSISFKTTSIKDAACLVRESFADIPGVSALDDAHTVLLLPILASGAGVIDTEVLCQRAQQLRTVLDSAELSSGWITEPALLVARVNRGIDRYWEQMQRLGREAQYGLPREHIMNSEAEVYKNFVEQTLRDLGGPLLIAFRVIHGKMNRTYETEVVDGIVAGDVVSGLQEIGAPCGGVVELHYRNASAHGDVEVTDTGIVLTERHIKDGRGQTVSIPLSDAEFGEALVALQEILLALQLTLLPWLWSASDQGLVTAVSTAPVTKRQREQTIELLGGMAGLHSLELTLNGKNATISATSHKDDTDRRESTILSIVPGAFGAMPDAQKVSLSITGLHPVTFDRSEFLESERDETLHKLPMLGLVTARWLLESGSPWSERDEATYVTFPLAMLHLQCCRLAGSQPPRTENIDQAAYSLRLVLTRLDEVLPEARRSQQTLRAVELATTLATSLTGIAESRRGQRSPAEGERLGRTAAATLEAMHGIQEAAKALRDSGSQ
jgi:hypothetical protein